MAAAARTSPDRRRCGKAEGPSRPHLLPNAPASPSHCCCFFKPLASASAAGVAFGFGLDFAPLRLPNRAVTRPLVRVRSGQGGHPSSSPCSSAALQQSHLSFPSREGRTLSHPTTHQAPPVLDWPVRAPSARPPPRPQHPNRDRPRRPRASSHLSSTLPLSLTTLRLSLPFAPLQRASRPSRSQLPLLNPSLRSFSRRATPAIGPRLGLFHARRQIASLCAVALNNRTFRTLRISASIPARVKAHFRFYHLCAPHLIGRKASRRPHRLRPRAHMIPRSRRDRTEQQDREDHLRIYRTTDGDEQTFAQHPPRARLGGTQCSLLSI